MLGDTGCSDHKDNRQFGRCPFMLEIMAVAWERRVVSEEPIFLPETKIMENICEPPKTTLSGNSLYARTLVHSKMK